MLFDEDYYAANAGYNTNWVNAQGSGGWVTGGLCFGSPAIIINYGWHYLSENGSSQSRQTDPWEQLPY